MNRFFELMMLADQSLVQAGWAPLAPRDDVTAALASGPVGRAPLPLEGAALRWSFEPGLGITTLLLNGHLTLLSLLLAARPSPREAEAVALWMDALRAAQPIRQVNGDDPEAFEIFRRVRERPFCASVLLPEGTREKMKPVVDLHHAVASAFFAARFE